MLIRCNNNKIQLLYGLSGQPPNGKKDLPLDKLKRAILSASSLASSSHCFKYHSPVQTECQQSLAVPILGLTVASLSYQGFGPIDAPPEITSLYLFDATTSLGLICLLRSNVAT